MGSPCSGAEKGCPGKLSGAGSGGGTGGPGRSGRPGSRGSPFVGTVMAMKSVTESTLPRPAAVQGPFSEPEQGVFPISPRFMGPLLDTFSQALDAKQF